MKFGFILASILVLSLTGCGTVDNPAVMSGNVTVLNPVSTVTIQGHNSAGQAVTPQVDNTTGAMDMIDIEHTYLHEGRLFSAYDVYDMPNSANRTILLYTPASGVVHIYTDIETESEAEWEFFEGAIASANGTAITPVNRDRLSSTAATVLIYYAPTITSSGTRIAIKHWGSGKGVGGGDSPDNEFMLKQSTYYLVRVTNYTTSANHATIKLTWYK